MLRRYKLGQCVAINLVGIEAPDVDTPFSAVGAAMFAAIFDACGAPLSSKDLEVLKQFIRNEVQYTTGYEKIPNYGAIDFSRAKNPVGEMGECEVCQHFERMVHFYPDQEQFVGEVNLQGALNAFQKFPWEAQLQEVRTREMTSSSPTVKFKTKAERALSIWMHQDNNFEIYYENRYEAFYAAIPLDISWQIGVSNVEDLFAQYFARSGFTSRDYSDLEGPTVEDLICFFFKGTIEGELELLPKKDLYAPKLKGEQTKLRFEYAGSRPYHLLGLVSLSLFILVAFGATIVMNERVHFGLLSILILFALVMGWPRALVKTSHWLASKNSFLEIDKMNKTFKFSHGKTMTQFARTDIRLCEVFYSTMDAKNFVRVHLRDGNQIVISSMLVNAFELIAEMNLHYVQRKVMHPIIASKALGR